MTNAVLPPLLSDLKSIRTELQSVQRQLTGAAISDDLRDRLLDLSVTWSAAVAPQLRSNGYVADVNKIQAPLDLLAQTIVTGKISNQTRDYVKGLLLDFFQLSLKVSKNPRLATTSAHAQRIFPEIPDLPNEMIPKDLIGWTSEIKAFLNTHPYDQNVFIMVRYARQSNDLTEAIMRVVKNSRALHKSLNPVIARDHPIVDNLNNPIACLLCCRYGIAVFDSVSRKPEINPNVAYEIGYMHLLQRKCLILKARKIKTLPSDILAKLYQQFVTPADSQNQVKEWLSTLAD